MEKFFDAWSRRKFIGSLSGTAMTMVLKPSVMWAVNNILSDPKVAAIVASTMGIDTHNHIDVPLDSVELPGPQIDLRGTLIQSGLSAVCMTFAVDYQKLINPGDAYNRFITGLDAMDTVLLNNNMSRALNIGDLTKTKKSNTPTVIQSVEGCHFIEGNPDRVEVAFNRGIRHLGLLHDNDASVPLGDVYTNEPKYGGLTSLGANVIEECDKLGILIDLAHGSNDMVNAALKVTKNPIIISHTGLDTRLGENLFMAKMMRPRLISEKQAKIVADAGGIIGVWTHLAANPQEYVKNIKAMVNVAGIEHVCIGTDTKITPPYRSPKQQMNWGRKPDNDKSGKDKEVERLKVDDKKGKPRVGERTNEAWEGQKDGFYYVVVDAMLKEGFTESEISKIGGENFCRVFNDATKG